MNLQYHSCGGRAGQAMLEYVLAFAALAALCVALAYFVRAARSSATATAELVTSEYP